MKYFAAPWTARSPVLSDVPWICDNDNRKIYIFIDDIKWLQSVYCTIIDIGDVPWIFQIYRIVEWVVICRLTNCENDKSHKSLLTILSDFTERKMATLMNSRSLLLFVTVLTAFFASIPTNVAASASTIQAKHVVGAGLGRTGEKWQNIKTCGVFIRHIIRHLCYVSTCIHKSQ